MSILPAWPVSFGKRALLLVGLFLKKRPNTLEDETTYINKFVVRNLGIPFLSCQNFFAKRARAHCATEKCIPIIVLRKEPFFLVQPSCQKRSDTLDVETSYSDRSFLWKEAHFGRVFLSRRGWNSHLWIFHTFYDRDPLHKSDEEGVNALPPTANTGLHILSNTLKTVYILQRPLTQIRWGGCWRPSSNCWYGAIQYLANP